MTDMMKDNLCITCAKCKSAADEIPPTLNQIN